MIPKIVHYCWFGGQDLPAVEQSCINSWKKLLPDYEFKRWDESSIDLCEFPYMKEAYDNKKYAFVSDVVRMIALVEEGGIYLDTDVKLLSSLNAFLTDDAFCGYENRSNIGTAIIGAVDHFPIFEEMINYYKSHHFVLEDGSFDQTTNVQILSRLLDARGYVRKNEETLVDGLHIYERHLFYPKKQRDGSFDINSECVAVHFGSGSWLTERERRRGESLLWRNIARPALRKCRSTIVLFMGESFSRKFEAALRKRLR